jgi:hypothetical protein
MHHRLLALLVLAAPLAAAPVPAFRAGLWQFRNVPTGAALDGRPLADLPAAPATDETICLTPAAAADPARWLTRDTGADCTITRRSLSGGKVDIAGSCPPAEDGGAPGTLHLSGTWSPNAYRLTFATVAHGENGAMSFTGTMAGHRVGDCPAAAH